MRWRIAVCAVASFAALPAQAVEIPELGGAIVDRAHLLGSAQREALANALADLGRDTGQVLVVHTTPSLEGLSIAEYAAAVDERWRTQHTVYARAVILTAEPKERMVHIDVPAELAETLPSATLGWIIRERIQPGFRGADPADGIVAGVNDLAAALRGELLPVGQPAPPRAVPKVRKPQRHGLGPSPEERRELRHPSPIPPMFWLVLGLAALGSVLAAERRERSSFYRKGPRGRGSGRW